MGPSGSAPDVTREDALGVFSGLAEPHTPLTTGDVASTLECSEQAAERRLRALADDGAVRTRQVGDGLRVWWQPADADLTTSHRSTLAEFGAFVRAVEEYAIFTLETDGTVASWNDGAERIKGYAAAEIVGEHFSTFYTDEDVAAGVPEANLETAAERGRVEDEGWRVRADGTRFWADVVVTAIRDDEGDLVGFTKVTRDKTEQREYEQQLRRERDLTEQILETVPLSISLVEADGQFVRANEQTLDRVGLDEDELMDANVNTWDLYDADGDPIPVDERPWERALAAGEPVTGFECQIDLSTLGRRWLSVNAAPLGDGEDAGDDRVVVTVEDVTDQKERERQLRRERDQTAQLLRTVPVGIAVQNADRETLRANEHVQAEMGLSEQEFREQPVDEGEWQIYDVDGDPLGPEETPSARAIEQEAPVFDEEIVMESPDGERTHYRINAAPLFDDDGAVERVVLAGEDITELKLQQRQLERQKSELETELGEIFERISDAFYALDDEWRFTHVNERAAEIVGHAPDELLGQVAWDQIPGGRDGALGERFRTAMDTQEPITFEEYVPVSDVWLEFNVYPSESGLSTYFRDVTERKERERELERTERRYRALVENFPNGAVALVDEDLYYQTVGGSPTDVADRTVEEVEGGYVGDVLPDELADELVPYYEAAIRGERGEFEADVGERIFQFRVVPVRDAAGDIFAALGMSQDVTDQKRRERELTKYETIVETVNDGIYVKDDDGYFTMVNDAYAELTGYDREELVGAHSSLVVDEAAIEQSRALEAEMERGDNPTMEATIQTAGDEAVPAEATFTTFETGDGERNHVGVVRDISERLAQRRRLEESERRHRTLVENFPDGAVGLFDEDLEYTAVGGKLLDAAGVGKEDRVGSTVSDVYPDDLVETIEPHFESALDGESNTFEAELHDRHLLAHTLPVTNADDEVFAGMLVVQDVTEQVEREQRLEELVDRLEASNERLEQFAYAASHDLQEPLRMVSSYLRLIEQRYADELDDDGREFIDYAVDGADRMRDMIEGLLQYSRVDTRGDPFGPVDLNAVLADVRDDLQVRIDETDADIDAEDLPVVEGDRGQLRQVFQNLLDNAIEYSGDDPPEITVSAQRRGDWWEISVTDQGIGIDPADADRVFEVFQRLHAPDDHAGTGIGLALVERIIERHGVHAREVRVGSTDEQCESVGGDIWVASEPGEGATFTFTLPAAGERDE